MRGRRSRGGPPVIEEGDVSGDWNENEEEGPSERGYSVGRT